MWDEPHFKEYMRKIRPNRPLLVDKLTDEMKKPVLDHLRTKYKDNRKIVSDILGFRGKQSLSNEISRLTKK